MKINGRDYEPDINIRHLYRGDQSIHLFNEGMNPWEEWQDEAIQRVCNELNRIEEWDNGGL
jgi:hypothetical protein